MRAALVFMVFSAMSPTFAHAANTNDARAGAIALASNVGLWAGAQDHVDACAAGSAALAELSESYTLDESSSVDDNLRAVEANAQFRDNLANHAFSKYIDADSAGGSYATGYLDAMRRYGKVDLADVRTQLASAFLIGKSHGDCTIAKNMAENSKSNLERFTQSGDIVSLIKDFQERSK